MDLRTCDLCMCLLMFFTSWTGILSQKAKAPEWKPKSRPAHQDSIVTKNEGNEIKLTCGVNGSPKPSIIWYKDDKVFNGLSRPKTKLHRYSLLMKNATFEDKGNYKCIVTNVHGSLNFTFLVTVIKLTWPLEVEEPKNQTVKEGEDAIFTCRPINDEDASIKWIKRNATGGIQTSAGRTSGFLGETQMLVIRNVSMKDSGEYVCFVGNYFGLKQVTAWLTVIPTPTTTTTSTSTTTTTPTTTTTTPTTTTTTPTTTTPTTTTPTTTTTKATTAMATTIGTKFWPEPTPQYWEDELDEKEQRKKERKKKKKDKKRKKKKDKKKKKKNRNRNKEEETEYQKPPPDFLGPNREYELQTEPSEDWFNNHNDRVRDFDELPNNRFDNDKEVYPDIDDTNMQEKDDIDNSQVDLPKDLQGDKTNEKKSEVKDIDVWTIYIIVGSVAGGVLLIGVVAIIVALCCNRYEDEGYKHTNV